MLSNETPPQMPDHALSHGYPMGGFLGHFIPGQDIPRPVGHQQYADELKAYYFSISIDSPEVPGPGHAPKTRPESLSPHQGANDPPESGAQRETNEQNRIIKKQNAQDLQSLAAEYRQLDRDQDLKEDAETDEETSQDPRSNGKNCREK
jgi:hypothetical protein